MPCGFTWSPASARPKGGVAKDDRFPGDMLICRIVVIGRNTHFGSTEKVRVILQKQRATLQRVGTSGAALDVSNPFWFISQGEQHEHEVILWVNIPAPVGMDETL